MRYSFNSKTKVDSFLNLTKTPKIAQEDPERLKEYFTSVEVKVKIGVYLKQKFNCKSNNFRDIFSTIYHAIKVFFIFLGFVDAPVMCISLKLDISRILK